MSALTNPTSDALTKRYMMGEAAPKQTGRFSAPEASVTPHQVQTFVSQAPARQAVTPLATPAANTTATEANPSSLVVDVPVTLSWEANGGGLSQRKSLSTKVVERSKGKSKQSETKAKLLTEVAPLGQVLKSKGLATDDGCNVSKMYLATATNYSDEPVAIQVRGVNGANLDSVVHTDVDDWSTISLMPGQTIDYTSHNNGYGRQLVDNPLNHDEAINVRHTAKELMSFAQPSEHFPGESVVHVNLSQFYDENGTVNDAAGSAALEKNPLGWIVYGNAMPKFAAVEGIEQLVGGPLPGYGPEAKQSELLPSVKISQMSLAPPGTLVALVPNADLENLVTHYGIDKIAPATKTKPSSHKLTLIHSEGVPTQGGKVRAHFTYVIDHSGRKYDQTETAV